MSEEEASILIVDDDAPDLASIERALEPLGATLYTERDPHEVLRATRRENPDVVVLDALLPGLSGFDLCRQIKSDGSLKGIQVVVITGVYLRQQYRQEALQQFKADGFMTKPFRPPELQRLVAQLLAKKTRRTQRSFLQRLGLPSATADAEKRGFLGRPFGFLGRLFGKSEEEEALTRIAPIAPIARSRSPRAAQAATATATATATKARSKQPSKEAAVEAPAAPESVAEAASPSSPESLPRLAEPESKRDAVAESAPSPMAEAGNGEVQATASVDADASPGEPAEAASPEAAEEEAFPSAKASDAAAESAAGDASPEPLSAGSARDELSETPDSAPAESSTAEEAAVFEASTPESPKEPDDESAASGDAPPDSAFEEAAQTLELAPSSEETDVEWTDGPASVPPNESPGHAAGESAPELLQLRNPSFRVGQVPIYGEQDFHAELKREVSKCRRVGRPLTLILVQVDDLSQIVELFGEEIREAVLRHVAGLATWCLREIDLVGMVTSKDLIALIAFASDKYGGSRIVNRMRKTVQKTPFRVGEELPPIMPALRFGMSSYPDDGEDVVGLIAQAYEDIEGR